MKRPCVKFTDDLLIQRIQTGKMKPCVLSGMSRDRNLPGTKWTMLLMRFTEKSDNQIRMETSDI